MLDTTRSARKWSLLPVLLGLPLAGGAEVNRTILPILPPDFHGLVAPTLKASRPDRANPLTAPAGAPNVMVILLDDAGYGQTGTFGGLIDTPTLDRLAQGGLRYTRFHVTALCSPTRSAVLTGRNNHSVGMGVIANWNSGFPGYTTSIPKSAAMVSEVLRENGYATAAIGKWHLIPNAETTQAGPFDHWPTHQGFDYFYGFIGGETDQWHPEITEGTHPMEMEVPVGRSADYTLNESLADKAINWLKVQRSNAPDRPFFIYYTPGATHAPHQAPKAWIDRYRGKFDMGWDRYREIVLERQKRLGVVPEDTVLTPRPAEIPAWDSLTPDQQKLDAHFMEIFAGFMAQTDHEIGRVIDTLQQLGELDNTLIFFIAGDNGASLEGGPVGTSNLMANVNGITESTAEMLSRYDQMGGPNTTPFYPAGWGWAGNAPFQWGKQVAAYFGGTRDPLVISWPERIKQVGGIRSQYHHVIDLAPTILEAAGIPAPTSVNGVIQQPIEGVSMLYTFDQPAAEDRRTTQYSEMLGNRSIYHDGWVAAARSGQVPWKSQPGIVLEDQPWQLYHISADYSESADLAARYPGKLKELQALFATEAVSHHVYPLNSTAAGRSAHETLPGPQPVYTYYAGTDHIYNATAPTLENRSHTLTAYVTIPPGGANGVLICFGGEPCGFSLFLKDGKPSYTYNYFKREITTVTAPQALPPGKAVIQLNFAYDGGGVGQGATVSLRVNGAEVAEKRLLHTVPFEYSFDETLDVGRDFSTPVGDYAVPFAFTGTLDRVEVAYGPVTLAYDDQATFRRGQERAAAVRD